MKTREQAAREIKDLIWDRTDVEINIDENDLEPGMDFDDLNDAIDIDRSINEQSDIVYYSRAMEFLAKHDMALDRSLELAYEMGYELKNLNSEVLASLLNNEMMREGVYILRDEIEDILNEIEDEEDEE